MWSWAGLVLDLPYSGFHLSPPASTGTELSFLQSLSLSLLVLLLERHWLPRPFHIFTLSAYIVYLFALFLEIALTFSESPTCSVTVLFYCIFLVAVTRKSPHILFGAPCGGDGDLEVSISYENKYRRL